MINFRSPSQNSPFLLSVYFLSLWVISNVFVIWGTSLINLNYFNSMLVFGIIITLIFSLGAIFCIIATISFLFVKKYKDFFISISAFIVLSIVLLYADYLLAPYKIKSIFNNASIAADKASEDPNSAKEMKFYGNETPRKICYGEKNKDNLFKCRVCACSSNFELTLVGEEPRCYFYKPGSSNRADKYISAPCSPVELSQDDNFTPPITNYSSIVFYSEYKYRNQVLETCNEYATWSGWSIDNAKVQCEQEVGIACVVKYSSPCSLQGAKSICEKKPDKPNFSYRRIEYTNSGNSSGFDYEKDCKSLLRLGL